MRTVGPAQARDEIGDECAGAANQSNLVGHRTGQSISPILSVGARVEYRFDFARCQRAVVKPEFIEAACKRGERLPGSRPHRVKTEVEVAGRAWDKGRDINVGDRRAVHIEGYRRAVGVISEGNVLPTAVGEHTVCSGDIVQGRRGVVQRGGDPSGEACGDTWRVAEPKLRPAHYRVGRVVPFGQWPGCVGVSRVDPAFDGEAASASDVQLRACRHHYPGSNAIAENSLPDFAPVKEDVAAEQPVVAGEDILGIDIERPPANRPNEVRRMSCLECELIDR